MKSLYLTLALSVLFFACTDNSGNNNDPDNNVLLILNEGAFGQGNASISTWNPDTRELRHNVFASRNSPRVLGDVLQSGLVHDNEIFLVVNNSRKIEILDAETFASKRTITFSGQVSPRYLTVSEAGKGYVTSLFTNYVYEVDIREATVTDSILVGSGTEGIWYYNQHVFVSRNLNSDFSTASGIAVINTVSKEVVDVLETGPGPQGMVMNSGTLWVNVAGTWGGDNGGLVQINPETRTILREINLSANTSGIASLDSSPNIYFISDGIKRLNVNDINNITTISDNNYYAISVLHDDEIVYASDAKNFAQAGVIYLYKEPQVRADSIQSGIVPRNVLKLH